MHRSYGLSDVPRVRRLAPLLSHGGASHLLARGQKLIPTRAKFCAHRLSPSRTCPSLLKLGPLGDLSAHSLPRLASLARRIRHDKEKLDRTGGKDMCYMSAPRGTKLAIFPQEQDLANLDAPAGTPTVYAPCATTDTAKGPMGGASHPIRTCIWAAIRLLSDDERCSCRNWRCVSC